MGEVTRYAIINRDTNVVENIVMWDGRSNWAPPENCIAERVDDAYVGTGMRKTEEGFVHVAQLPTKKTMEEYLREKYLADEGVLPDE